MIVHCFVGNNFCSNGRGLVFVGNKVTKSTANIEVFADVDVDNDGGDLEIDIAKKSRGILGLGVLGL